MKSATDPSVGSKQEQTISNRLKKASPHLSRLIGAFALPWLILRVSAYFGWEPLKDSPLGPWIFISLALNLWLAGELLIHLRQKPLVVTRKPESVASVLIEELERLSREGDYEAILRHREAFSRSLYVEGKLRERVRLGEIAEDAAACLGDRRVQAASLIDDLGWSLVMLRNYEKAEKAISYGLRIAQEIDDHYWIAKANRHLAGIFLEAQQYGKTRQKLDGAKEAAEKITEDRAKKEMLAGIEYGFALTLLFTGKARDALPHLDESERLRKEVGDRTRIVRIYSLKGKVAETLGDLSLAKDYYRRGLEEAKKIGRKDEMIRNHLGLSRVFNAEGDKDRSLYHRDLADEMQETTPVPYELEDKALELRKVT